MAHCEDDVIALAALGERLSPGDAGHLSTCRDCDAEVERLRRVVGAVRVDLVPGPAVDPPARVWEGIAARTGVRSVDGAGVQPVDRAAPATVAAPVATLRPRRRSGHRVRWPIAAVAASALVIGAAGGSVVTRLLGRDPAPTVVASTALSALPLAPSASGRAVVVQTASGPRLDVDVVALGAQPGHFYEVWLIDRRVQKMVAIGVLSGTTGEFVIPGGLSLRDYPVVDISVQLPGDPRHSGRSVLRGTIDA